MISLKELMDAIIDEEIKPKDIPAGTSWRVGAGKGWAAKNRAGETNYWYSPDDQKNKENADKWRMSEVVGGPENISKKLTALLRHPKCSDEQKERITALLSKVK